MNDKRTNLLVIILMAIMIVLMISIVGLFLQVQLMQRQIQKALMPVNPLSEGLDIGATAPDFSLPDLGGKTVSIKEFYGNKVLLAFFNPDCSACQKMLPNIKHISQKMQVIMISRESVENKQQLIENLDFPVLVWDEAVAQEYKVFGTPFFFIIDEEGKVENSGYASTLEELEYFIKGSR